MEVVYSLDKMDETAAQVCKQLEDGSVIAFHGEMGAGKTTFIQALCRAMGVQDHMASPTFSIINEYAYKSEGNDKRLYHMDLYRLRSEEEAIQTGVEDCLYSGHLCLVEWPEKAPGIFPENTLHIYLEVVDSSRRRLRIERK